MEKFQNQNQNCFNEDYLQTVQKQNQIQQTLDIQSKESSNCYQVYFDGKLLEKLNEQKYVSLMITEVAYQDNSQYEFQSQQQAYIPQEYWQAFQAIFDKEQLFIGEDVKNTKEITYLRVRLINNMLLEEQLKHIEIGLLLIGESYADIECEVNDKLNFMGKFNYHHIKMQNEGNLNNTHLFFSILHEHDSDFSQQIEKGDILLNNNILIVEPDINLQASLIAKSDICYRSSLVKTQFKSTEQASQPLFKYSILHDLFQELMSMDGLNEIQYNDSFLVKLMYKIHTKYLEYLYLLGTNINISVAQLMKEAKKIFDFVKKYRIKGEFCITKKSKRQIKMLNLVESQMQISDDIFGIKGYIDSVFSCEVEDYSDNRKVKQTLMLPFELKTGSRKNDYFLLQNQIYSLLLNQKFQSKQNLEGFLYYLTQDELTTELPTKKSIIKLLNSRNKLAKLTKNMNKSGKVPLNELQDDQICNYCFEKNYCYASKVVDDIQNLKDLEDIAEDIDIDFVDNLLEHEYYQFFFSIPKQSKVYLKKWLDLIQMEQQYDSDTKIANRQILQNEADNQLLFLTDNFDQFFLSQIQQLNSQSKEEQLSLNTEEQKESECIFQLKKTFPQLKKMLAIKEFYKEGESFALSQNDIKCKFYAVLEEKIVDEQDKSIILKLRSIQNQVKFDQKKVESFLQTNTGNSLQWSVELNDLEYYADQRQNVLNLVLKSSGIDDSYVKKKKNELISVIIGNSAPKFQNKQFSDAQIERILNDYPNLLINKNQSESIMKVLKSESLTCIQGMPGTGKTYLIAHLIKILADLNMTLLVTSYTNSAVDNIIVKLLDLFPGIKDNCLRIGSNKNQVHPSAQTILYDPQSFTSENQYTSYIKTKKIFFSTIISSNNKLLQSKKVSFDYCIIDEASQCVEPLCIGPMQISDKSILIGDHKQLQPLVKNEEAGKKGLSISLFERICQKFPSCSIKLLDQFRMNNTIMELSNIMVYEHQLKAFDNNIGNSIIQIKKDELQKIRIQSINHCIQPSNKIVFIDTSLFKKNQIVEQNNQQIVCKQPIDEHSFQTQFICLLIKRLQEVNIQNKNMALITPYNFYRYQIQKQLKLMKIQQQDLQLFTVDKSQGIERDIIILHIPDKIGNEHLLSNFRRTNVALTRSKMKLIIVGNSNILYKNDIIDFLMTILSEKSYVYQLNQLEIEEVQKDCLQLENNNYI
ncbi:hypothetical protein ABPG74_014587 [Tetrahymena malaccensis]